MRRFMSFGAGLLALGLLFSAPRVVAPTLALTPTASATLRTGTPSLKASGDLQIVLVLDVSGSMSAIVYKSELPAELADLKAEIDAIENDPEYVRLSQEIDAFYTGPESKALDEKRQTALNAVDDWLYQKGYVETFFDVEDELDRRSCGSWFADKVYYATAADDVETQVAGACQIGNVSKTLLQDILKLEPYLEDEEYQNLAKGLREVDDAIAALASDKKIGELQQQLYQIQNSQHYWDLQSKFNTRAKALGLPDRLTLAQSSSGAMLDISKLDNTISGRETLIALVTFDNASKIVDPLTLDYEQLRTGIQKLRPGGGTSIGRGMRDAFKVLQDSGESGRPTMIVLLTDGYTTGRQYVARRVPQLAREARISVCTIGFGNKVAEVDNKLLKGLADDTGGAYLFASSAQELTAFFVACRQGLTSKVISQLAGVAHQDETVKAGSVYVSDNVGEVTVTLNYVEGRLVMQLVDPSGNVVDASYHGASISQSGNIQLATISNPAVGDWVVRVSGEEAPKDGATYNIAVSSDVIPNTPTPTPTLTPTATPTVIPTLLPTATPTPTPKAGFLAKSGVRLGIAALCACAVILLILLGLGVWVFQSRKKRRPAA